MNNSNLITPFNKIKTTISGFDDKIFKAQGSSKCFKDEIANLDARMEAQKLEIKKQDNDLKEVTSHGEFLENNCRTLKGMLPIDQESLLIHKQHHEFLLKILRRDKEEGDKKLDEYLREYDQAKNKLESISAYQILRNKQKELKRAQYKKKWLQVEIKDHKLKKLLELDIRQKIFYADFINLAEKEVAYREHKKYVKMDSDLEKIWTSLFKEYKVARNRDRQMMNSCKRNIQIQQAVNCDLEKKFAEPSAAPSNVPPQRKDIKSSLENLNYSLNKSTYAYEVPKPIHDIGAHLLANNQHLPDPSKKINILENKVVQKSKPGFKKVDSLSKEALKAKMEQVVLSFRSKRSTQNIFKSSNTLRDNSAMKTEDLPEKKTEINTEIKTTAPLSASTANISQNIQPGSGATQALEQMNILSQEANALNMLSQEPGQSKYNALKAFKYDPVTSVSGKSSRFPESEGSYQFPKAKINFKAQQLKENPQFFNYNNVNKQISQNSLKPKENSQYPNNLAGSTTFTASQEKQVGSMTKKNSPNNNQNNNATKVGENNFKLKTSIKSVPNFNPQQDIFGFGFNQAKRQKLVNFQEPLVDQDNLPAPTVPESLSPEIQNMPPIARESDIQYNFENFPNFLDTTGDFNAAYELNADVNQTVNSAASPDFGFGKSSGFNFTFN